MRIKWLKYAIFNTHQEPFNGKKKKIKIKKELCFLMDQSPHRSSFWMMMSDTVLVDPNSTLEVY
jgi:hypothetical protein